VVLLSSDALDWWRCWLPHGRNGIGKALLLSCFDFELLALDPRELESGGSEGGLEVLRKDLHGSWWNVSIGALHLPRLVVVVRPCIGAGESTDPAGQLEIKGPIRPESERLRFGEEVLSVISQFDGPAIKLGDGR
jgi:hypothetical protein